MGRLRGWFRPGNVTGLLALGTGWGALWGTGSSWNPVAFTAMWSGAAVLMWSFGRGGHPGWRRHACLALASVPLWWWFEAINARVENWEYVFGSDYGAVEYWLLLSLAFSTVVPAIVSATSLSRRLFDDDACDASTPGPGFGMRLLAVGVLTQVAVLWFPDQLFPLVWIAPALALDGVVAAFGGRSLAWELLGGRWRRAAAVALAGLICGALWEFWNFWATPKWVYHIPILDFGKVFEMPILGYGGYIPFAWAVTQFVGLLELLRAKAMSDAAARGERQERAN